MSSEPDPWLVLWGRPDAGVSSCAAARYEQGEVSNREPHAHTTPLLCATSRPVKEVSNHVSPPPSPTHHSSIRNLLAATSGAVF